MRVCLVCVCYNAYDEARLYLRSLQESFNHVIGSMILDVVFVDNSTNINSKVCEDLQSSNYSFRFYYVENDNTGYFPGVAHGISKSKLIPQDYDYVIVSNVDLEVSRDFFKTLSHLHLDDTLGMVAPAIISKSDQRDINPKIVARPTRNRLLFNKFLFRYSMFYKILLFASATKNYLKSRRASNIAIDPKPQQRVIYASHGSFMIFTSNYIKKINIDYPMFLFGEELYAAEEARLKGLRVEHHPEIHVYDLEHASTSKVLSKLLRLNHVKSLDYIIQKYY